MAKRGPGRPPKKRSGRPPEDYLGFTLPNTPVAVDIDTRLDTAMTNLEAAIKEAITKLKGCI